jgi:hypothetical protein
MIKFQFFRNFSLDKKVGEGTKIYLWKLEAKVPTLLTKKCHTVGIFPNSNSKIVEIGKIDSPNTNT